MQCIIDLHTFYAVALHSPNRAHNCFGRLFKSFASADEVAVLAKLEKRFVRLEKPLFNLALNIHPMYAKIGRAIVDGGEVDAMTLKTWVNVYGDRWGNRAASGAV
jgi:hypothetical protein